MCTLARYTYTTNCVFYVYTPKYIKNSSKTDIKPIKNTYYSININDLKQWIKIGHKNDQKMTQNDKNSLKMTHVLHLFLWYLQMCTLTRYDYSTNCVFYVHTSKYT